MRKTIAGALAALAVVFALTGCESSPMTAPSSPAPTAMARPTPEIDVPVAAATPTPTRQSVPPVRVVAASIGLDIPVIPVGIEAGGFMELPVDPAVAGWYRFGPDPLASQGNTVISAHVDAPNFPIGPFSRLRDLAEGSAIEVIDSAGTVHRYAVQSVAYYAKSALPVREIFSRVGDPRLVLITCGGDFDAEVGRYADNVVAIAAPIPEG